MPIALIVAAAGKAQVIGKDGDMPWHFPSDFRHFKETTMGHPVLMGRVTYQSILERLGKPLPGRQNIVLTRDKNFHDDRVTVVHSLDEAKVMFGPDQTLFIIGGAKVYEQALPFADKIYFTHIDAEYEGDAFLSPVNPREWNLVDEKKTEENGVSIRFCVYQRAIK